MVVMKRMLSSLFSLVVLLEVRRSVIQAVSEFCISIKRKDEENNLLDIG